jgi:hypothetical protein
MKYILIIFTFILLIQCTAQNQIVNSIDCDSYFNKFLGDYYRKDVNNIINQYEGTWKWTGGSREFTLILIKQKHRFHQYANYNYYEDRLVGYYQVKENGVLIADTSSDDLSQDYRLKVHLILDCYSHITSIRFEDYKKKKDYQVILQKLSPTQMKFEGKMHEGSIIVPQNGTVMIPPGHTFPLDMILTKQ